MKFNHIYKNVEVFREREEKDKTEGKLKWTFKGEKKARTLGYWNWEGGDSPLWILLSKTGCKEFSKMTLSLGRGEQEGSQHSFQIIACCRKTAVEGKSKFCSNYGILTAAGKTSSLDMNMETYSEGYCNRKRGELSHKVS